MMHALRLNAAEPASRPNLSTASLLGSYQIDWYQNGCDVPMEPLMRCWLSVGCCTMVHLDVGTSDQLGQGHSRGK